MKNLILIILLLAFNDVYCQQDSLLNARSEAKQIYDTSCAAMVDSGKLELLRIFQASQALIEIDNQIIDQRYKNLNKKFDSLRLEINLISTLKSNIEQQVRNNKKLNTGINIFVGISSVLCLVLLFLFIGRRNKIRELKLLKREHEHLLALYQKQILELKQNLEIQEYEKAELLSKLSNYRVRTIRNEDQNNDEPID